MDQKIKGWSYPVLDMHPMSMAATVEIRANKRPGDVPCVAYIGTERVFTESEVKATIREMIMECGVFISRNGDVNATDIADIKHIAQKRLGIVLD